MGLKFQRLKLFVVFLGLFALGSSFLDLKTLLNFKTTDPHMAKFEFIGELPKPTLPRSKKTKLLHPSKLNETIPAKCLNLNFQPSISPVLGHDGEEFDYNKSSTSLIYANYRYSKVALELTNKSAANNKLANRFSFFTYSEIELNPSYLWQGYKSNDIVLWNRPLDIIKTGKYCCLFLTLLSFF